MSDLPTGDATTRACSWEEFRDSGLLWWVNRTLHLFGWAIVVELDENKAVERVFPARVTYMGFCEDAEDRGFLRLRTWMAANGPALQAHVEREQKKPRETDVAVASACKHPNRVRLGRDPEGDIQYRCPDCSAVFWWP